MSRATLLSSYTAPATGIVVACRSPAQARYDVAEEVVEHNERFLKRSIGYGTFLTYIFGMAEESATVRHDDLRARALATKHMANAMAEMDRLTSV